MESACTQIEEILWEYTRENTPLPDHVLEHLTTCKKCARSLQEASLLISLLHQVGQVSRTPDCRAKVMARITRTNRLLVLRKVFACAAVLLCLAATVPIISTHHETRQAHRSIVTPQSKTSTKETRVPGSTPTETSTRSTRQVAVSTDNPQNVATTNAKPAKPNPSAVAVNPPIRHPGKESKSAGPGTPEENPKSSLHDIHSPEQAGRNTEDMPITAIYVTWSEPQDQQQESVYVYVEQNVETGEITTCSVKASEEKVEIHIESTPDNLELPTRGCITIENNSKA